jgi:hypothetical protein
MAIVPPAADIEGRTARNIGVGCFTFFIGGVSGAMTAVLLGKIYAFLTRAPSCAEVPLCNWYVFAGYGALIGAVTLPVLAIMRLRRADVRSDRVASAPSGSTSNRG